MLRVVTNAGCDLYYDAETGTITAIVVVPHPLTGFLTVREDHDRSAANNVDLTLELAIDGALSDDQRIWLKYHKPGEIVDVEE